MITAAFVNRHTLEGMKKGTLPTVFLVGTAEYCEMPTTTCLPAWQSQRSAH